METKEEKYVSGLEIGEDLKKKLEYNPGVEIEVYTGDEDLEDLGYEEMSLEEFTASYLESADGDEDEADMEDAGEDDGQSDSEILRRLEALPMARDIYFRERKKHLDEDFVKRNLDYDPYAQNELHSVPWDERWDVLRDVMHLTARKVITNPIFKDASIQAAKDRGASEEEIRRIRRDGFIDADKLIASLEQVSGILKDASGVSPELKFDIQDTNKILVDLAVRVLEDYINYDVADLEKIVDWMNTNAKYPSYFSLYKDAYFTFVIQFVNESLKHGEDIGDVFIRALNNMIMANSRVLNVIIREKSEDFAPVAKYVKELKRKNRL